MIGFITGWNVSLGQVVDRASPLLDILASPFLHRLAVASIDASTLRTIQRFLERTPSTGRSLRELELKIMPFSPSFKSILDITPFLTSLTLTFHALANVQFSTFLAAPSCLPHLATLRLLIDPQSHCEKMMSNGPSFRYQLWVHPEDLDRDGAQAVDLIGSGRCEITSQVGEACAPTSTRLSTLELLWPSDDAAFGFQEMSSRHHSAHLDPAVLTAVESLAEFLARGATGSWSTSTGELDGLDSLLDSPILQRVNTAQYLYVSFLSLAITILMFQFF